jgi:hypothetical protein
MPFAIMSFMIIFVFTTIMEDISNSQDLILEYNYMYFFINVLLPNGNLGWIQDFINNL